MFNRLATRSAVALAVLMGMSEHALFEFHVSSWISDDNSGPSTLPEVDRITGSFVLIDELTMATVAAGMVGPPRLHR